MNQKAKLLVEVRLTKDSIHFNNSSIQIDDNTLTIDGSFARDNSKHMDLSIRSEGILLTQVAPLLSDHIQKILSQFAISQPIKADFNFSGMMKPGGPAPYNSDKELQGL